MADKAKQSATSFLMKAKTEAARAKQKVLEKMGKAEETVDISFKQEKDRFLAHYKMVKKVQKDTVKLLQAVQELSVCQATVAEDYYNLYDTSCSMYNGTLKNQDVCKLTDNARVQMVPTQIKTNLQYDLLDEQLRVDFLDPVTKYLGQFKELKNRLAELEVRRVDMDRYARDVRIQTEKGKPIGKTSTTEQKLEAARQNYVSLNDELMRDMPKLYNDRVRFFDPAFATYVTAVAEYYRQSAKHSADTLSFVSNVNRSALQDHPRVITAPEVSAASTKAMVDSRGTVNYGASPLASESHSTEPSQGTTEPKQRTASFGMNASSPLKPPPKTPAMQAKALYTFAAQDTTELSFNEGDIIIITKNVGEWWEGEINGKKGLIPCNYVQLI